MSLGLRGEGRAGDWWVIISRVLKPQAWMRVCGERVKTDPSSREEDDEDACHRGAGGTGFQNDDQDIQLLSLKPRGDPIMGVTVVFWKLDLRCCPQGLWPAPMPSVWRPSDSITWNCCLPNTFFQEIQKPGWVPKEPPFFPWGLYQNAGQETGAASTSFKVTGLGCSCLQNQGGKPLIHPHSYWFGFWRGFCFAKWNMKTKK